jgi:ABC-2 type transport system permease protein
MKTHLAVLAAYIRNSITVSLQQRVGAMFFVFGKLIRFGLFGVFVYYLLKQTTMLAGYNLNQTMVFYLTFNLIDGITQMLYREVYRFRTLIVSGDFDTVLVKPIHPFVRILLGGIDILDLIPLIIYIVLLIYSILQVGSITISGIVLYLLLIFNGVLISTAFHIMVLAMGIISTEVDHTIMIYRDITRMGTFPIDIYTQPIRAILTFVIPIGVMITFPVQALLGLLSIQGVVISLVIGVGSLIVALYFWRIALARYQSASS